MELLGTLIELTGLAMHSASGAKEIVDTLAERIGLEDVLANLIEEEFQEQKARVSHFCEDEPRFDKGQFVQSLKHQVLNVTSIEDLNTAIMPFLFSSISAPGANCPEETLRSEYRKILTNALQRMWAEIGKHNSITNKILLEQIETVNNQHSNFQFSLDQIHQAINALIKLSEQARLPLYEQDITIAPPQKHVIDHQIYLNPFLLVRSEDFNHNYDKLARLFQQSPDWDAIQSRTTNVFIEGGRGTGKSMLLRRLTAQATIAERRLSQPHATFDEVGVDYFGVYLKLTRGYYDRLETIDSIRPEVGAYLAQHELNVEIFDSFVDTLRWLMENKALNVGYSGLTPIINDLSSLFPKASKANTIEDLKQVVVRFEKQQINDYSVQTAFGLPAVYSGSIKDTVTFLRELSQIFHDRLFPNREMRLFLLVDEFETLLKVQQTALNTVMKMRLPDLTLKVAVRKSGRKTQETFTPGDPIQDPRDYTLVPIDYDVTSADYSRLLEGIAEKRLIDAQYTNTKIKTYLPSHKHADEVTPSELEAELDKMWLSGKRRNDEINDEFKEKYTVAAVYRILAQKGKRKSFAGFDQFVLLSSGIISNFMELAKYTFFYALSDEINLQDNPAIPFVLQSKAAYAVSKRLFNTIESNVLDVGSELQRMMLDIASILRRRLLTNASEPECNRLALSDYNGPNNKKYKLLEKIFDGAETWSVLHIQKTSDAFRPKNTVRLSNVNVLINRIYCPMLDISPRTRWRVEISVDDLCDLVNPLTREVTYQRLMKRLGEPTEALTLVNLFQESENDARTSA